MIFVSHDRMFLRGLGSRVLELGGESGTDRHPTVYPLRGLGSRVLELGGESGTDRHHMFILGHTLSTCRSLDTRRLGSIRRPCRALVQRRAGWIWCQR